MRSMIFSRCTNAIKRLRPILSPIGLVMLFVLLCSHDLFIHMDSYFVQPHKTALLSLYNGSFEASENTIARDRMIDASVTAHGIRVAVTPDQWKDRDSTCTQLVFNTGDAGTYVVGVSTKARNIELSAEKFNSYLEHDGILDMLERRTQNGDLEQDAIESYQKHVKAIYQVGQSRTDDWSTELGYPIEFIPLQNPYSKYIGDSIQVQLRMSGEPLAKQLVYADYIQSDSHTHGKHSHEHTHGEESHTHTSGQQLRTDDRGVVNVSLPVEGRYYLRTIHMVQADDDAELTHRSKWATLTFEVGHEHGAGAHVHEHDEGGGIPTWVFVLGSFLIVGILFVIFSSKK